MQPRKNTFKFFTFKEKVASIDIDIFRSRKYQHVEKSVDEVESYISGELDRRKELAVTLSHKKLLNQLVPISQTIHLVIYHKEKIISIILQSLRENRNDVDILKSVYSLVSTLCKDLRFEIYPFFFEILQELIESLHPNDEALVESLFVTFCYLFKYLLKQLTVDYIKLFTSYIPLIGHSKQYIRRFAADSLAYILRKVPKSEYPHMVKQIYEIVHRTLSEPNEPENQEDQNLTQILRPNSFEKYFLNGISQLFFHAMKGLHRRFHSALPSLLPAIFVNLRNDPNIEYLYLINQPSNIIQIIINLVIILSKCSDINSLGSVWNALKKNLTI